MAIFRASTAATAVVAAPRQAIWDVLADPDLLAELTPFLERIRADGDLWHWQMSGLEVLGFSVAPAFTERMTFVELERIDFRHEPPVGTVERSGVEGWYELTEVEGGTHLATSLEVSLDLPVPRLSAPAVTGAMRVVLATMGDRFSRNLLDHLAPGG